MPTILDNILLGPNKSPIIHSNHINNKKIYIESFKFSLKNSLLHNLNF